jgi:hypothetical protein
MFVNHRNSLVLRGVSVRCDGPAVDLRLGSYETNAQNPQATPISKRHPSQSCEAAMRGRLSHAGALSRRGPALFAGRTNVQRWSAAVGGPWFTAAVRLCSEWAKQPASVADTVFQRPSRALTAASTRGRGF